MPEPSAECRFYILTVDQVRGRATAFPRPACLILRRDGREAFDLVEDQCTFGAQFRSAAQAVWTYVRALLPEESTGWSGRLALKARGAIGGRSASLPLTLALLSLLLEDPLPDRLYATGIMSLADGWFAGLFLEGLALKAQALAPFARQRQCQVTLAIPYHRHLALPRPVERVRYARVAHTAQAAAEFLPRRADRVRERFQALSTLDHLPFEPAVRAAFRQSGAQTIVLDPLGSNEPSATQITHGPGGPIVHACCPGLADSEMIYHFVGERLEYKEYGGG